MTRMIAKFQGVPQVSPSMREVPLTGNATAVDAAHRLLTGQFDIVVLMTGVGFRHWLEAIEKHLPRDRFLESLSDVITIARGPKPVAAMKECGLTPTHRVEEPNTWRDLLALIDRQVPVANQSVCVQEYGKPNASLVAGLEARGATVTSLPIYRWEMPEDTGPLEENARRLAAGLADFALFTSAQQCVHLLEIADRLGIEAEVRDGLQSTVVASVGPTTSETLRDLELPVDFEPSHPKLGNLVAETAARATDLLQRKARWHAFRSSTQAPTPLSGAPWDDGPFMRACRRQPTDVTPVWLMRQAGRYMAEYRDVRAQVGFLELCRNPQLCSEVMVTAVQRLGVDAAIIFSDLLLILEPMGLNLEFAAGDGPVIHNPIRSAADVDRVRELEDVGPLDYVMQTVRQTRLDLPEDLPLIGFSGAPFTLASYMIEGGGSRNYLHTKSLMYGDEGAWHALMSRLVRSIIRYLNAQIEAGAQCVQLFDSWAGCLSPADYRRYVLPHVQQIIRSLIPGTPVINFATGNPALVPMLGEAEPDVVGLDWRIELDDAWRQLGHRPAVQGNLDPTVLLTSPETIRRHTQRILQQAGRRPGHIFNLGHGVLPQTPVDHARALVDAVHELSSR
ncbi:MAG: uroporphyrinogen decarboxylase [Pirellulales bacterium]